MKVIIPVAGEGRRLRPFTFTKPKPLLPVAGKPMLDHIMDKILPLQPTEVVFIVGHLGDMITDHVQKYKAETKISTVRQEVANGPGAAVWLARHTFDDSLLIDYGDTLFDTDLSVVKDCEDDGIIWGYKVEDPSRFGVLVTDDQGYMIRMVEKPKEFVSDLVNIGLYYIKNTELFAQGLEHAMNSKQEGKEVYLTEVFVYMMEHGAKLKVLPCPGWYDCGTPDALLDANKTLLPQHHSHAHESNNIIIPPVNIHPTAKVENCIVGPHVSVGPYSNLKAATLTDCIVDARAVVEDLSLKEMIVGEGMVVKGISPVKSA